MVSAEKNKVVLIGAGAHAKVISEIIENSPTLVLKGFIDKDLISAHISLEEKNKHHAKIIGTDSFLNKENNKYLFHLGLGADLIKVREKIIRTIETLRLRAVSIVHPNAYVSETAVTGKGLTILVNSIVNTNAVVGDYSCINTGAIVEHDCCIGNNVFIQPGAALAGRVTVGANSVIGMRAGIREKVSIGKNCIIGGGAFVCRDIPDNSVAFGVPAEIVKRNI